MKFVYVRRKLRKHLPEISFSMNGKEVECKIYGPEGGGGGGVPAPNQALKNIPKISTIFRYFHF